MQTILIKQPQPNVAEIHLNRPEKNNALNNQLITELTQQLKQCDNDPSINLVILRGEGKHFCAGADLVDMQAMVNASQEENKQDALQLAHLMQTLYHLSKPTIALTHGAVMGGAIGLVACCDIAIAADDSVFCFSEVKLGLIPAVISPYVLRAIGHRQARRYFLSAERFSAQQAMDINLVHEQIAVDEIDSVRDQWIQQITSNDATAITQCKRLIENVNDKPIDESLIDMTAEAIANIRVSPQGQAGLLAFLERRRS